jgi:hypothetical protein
MGHGRSCAKDIAHLIMNDAKNTRQEYIQLSDTVQKRGSPNLDLSTSSPFGFTLIFPRGSSSCHYRVNLYSDFRQQRTAGDFTSLLEWAKKTPITFKKCESSASIEAIILRLRIGPGFDFRKVPKRYVRFGIECFVSGTLQRRASSSNCQLMSKRRIAISSDTEGKPSV